MLDLPSLWFRKGAAGGRRAAGWELGLLLGVTALGLWFRWLYARDVSFFVDEYLTVRAAYKILERGLPLLLSGNFYSHGLLLSYLEAALIGLGGTAPWLERLPVLLLSTAAIPLTWWFGRRLFSAGAGLTAAALLALAPEAILWGGRVRMYAPLQFFVLAATAAFYFWVAQARDRPPSRCSRLLFVLAYWGALFSHAEAMLLLPLWGLWALGQRGWRWALRPANLAALALSGLAVAIEIGLRRIGPPVQARTAAGVLEPISRRYLGPALDWSGIQKVVGPLFLTPLRLPLTLLVLGGAAYLLLAWGWSRLGRSPRLPRPGGQRALLYLYALLLPTLAALLFVMDPSWKSPRYGLMLLAHFFLIAGAWLAWLGRRLQGRLGPRWGRIGVTAAAALIVVLSWPSALASTRESVPAYDRAFAYVAAHREPGDVVVTFLCPAAILHLGRCDYLAIPADFSGFAFQQAGRWVSGWDGTPILDGGADLARVLAEAPRVWLVVDEGRLNRRYEADFLQAVGEGMELATIEQEVLVFRSKEQRPLKATFGDAIRLLGYDLLPGATLSRTLDDSLTVVLYWEALAPTAQDYTVFVHLIDKEGQIRAQGDGPPQEGRRPTSSWAPGEVIRDPHTLALGPEAAAGAYRLLVGLYTLDDGQRLPVTAGPSLGDDRVLITSLRVR